MADRDPIQPIHEPTLAVIDEESTWVHDAADRFEHASAHDLLAWAIETFRPRLAISAAGGVDGMALIDMAWRIDPSIRVFTLDTGRLPPETYTLFEEVRERYGIKVEFEVPDGRRGRAPTKHRTVPTRCIAASTCVPGAARCARSSR